MLKVKLRKVLQQWKQTDKDEKWGKCKSAKRII